VFFHIKDAGEKLDILASLYDYLFELGYKVEKEAINIEGWPVQFLPIFNSLLEEAVEQANEVRFKRTKTRVMRAEHLVAIMFETGRPKDFARIDQFLALDVVDSDLLSDILARHELRAQWNKRYRKNPP